MYATAVIGRLILVALATAVLGPAVASAQTTPGIPGNPTNPADTVNNPHPTMPWAGITTPYGQLIRWLWVGPKTIRTSEGVDLFEPGFWVRETTAGYYYPARWVLQETTPGNYGWVLINGGAVGYKR